MDITRTITNRILNFANIAKDSGLVADDTDFAKAGGMTSAQLYHIKRDIKRNFTVEQLFKIGKRFNLDMNNVFFGTGSIQFTPRINASITEILKYVIVALEEEKREKFTLNSGHNTNVKKKIKNK